MPKRKKKKSDLDVNKLIDYVSIALVALLAVVVLSRSAGTDVSEDIMVQEVAPVQEGEQVVEEGIVKDFVGFDAFGKRTEVGNLALDMGAEMVAGLDNRIADLSDDFDAVFVAEEEEMESSMVAANVVKEEAAKVKIEAVLDEEAVSSPMSIGVRVAEAGEEVAKVKAETVLDEEAVSSPMSIGVRVAEAGEEVAKVKAETALDEEAVSSPMSIGVRVVEAGDEVAKVKSEVALGEDAVAAPMSIGVRVAEAIVQPVVAQAKADAVVDATDAKFAPVSFGVRVMPAN